MNHTREIVPSHYRLDHLPIAQQRGAMDARQHAAAGVTERVSCAAYSSRIAMPSTSADNRPASSLLAAARALSTELTRLHFPAPVAHVYDPLQYAWAPYEQYVTRFASSRKRVVLLGMNPGPFGMVQTGVPFGEVAAVRDWMGIRAAVEKPAHEHAKRCIEGFDCTRSEVSGRRLWGWAAQRCGGAERFFEHWFVLNYCPLALLEESGRNFTPDKLPAAVLQPLYAACDRHLASAIEALQPQWAIGIGGFAEKRIRTVAESDLIDSALARRLRIGCILHPSPASPLANRGWAEAAEKQLSQLGVELPC